jgi:general secretion pathway protein D
VESIIVDQEFIGWQRELYRLISHRLRSNSVYLGVEYIAKESCVRASVKLLTSTVVAALFFVSPFNHSVPCANAQLQDSNFAGGGAFQSSSAKGNDSGQFVPTADLDLQFVEESFNDSKKQRSDQLQSQQSPGAAPSPLFEARRALANGDVQTATAMVEKARQSGANFQGAADRPEIIEQMIAYQNKLVIMSREGDPDVFNQSAATFLLDQADGLMQYGDLATAEMLALQAKKFPVAAAAGQRTADDILQRIQQSRGANANTTVNNSGLAKTEASRLIAQAQLALAKKDLQEARSLTDRAMAMNVPDSAFGQGEVRPWEVDLRVREAMRFAQQASQASFAFNGQGQEQVKQADYTPGNDQSRNETASATAPATTPNRAMELYQSGLDALAMNKKDEAKRYFEMALNSADQLDRATQQAIQSHLASFNSGNAGPAIPNANMQDEVIDDQANSLRTQMQRMIFRERAKAERMVAERDPRGALQLLHQLRTQVDESALDGAAKQQLLMLVDREIESVNKFIQSNLPAIQNDEINRMRKQEVDQRNEDRWALQTKIQSMVENFNRLNEEQRYAEARIVAQQAYDLAPDMAETMVMLEKSKIQYYKDINDRTRDARADYLTNSLNEAEGAGAQHVTNQDPFRYTDPNSWATLSQKRLQGEESRKFNSPQEARIYAALRNERVQADFDNTPLIEVMQTFSQQLGVNVIFDQRALEAEGIPVDKPTTLSITNPISLESAMNIVLKNLNLTFVIEDEVIKVTNKDGQREEMIDRVLYIGDLVTPVNNFGNPTPMTFMSPYHGMNPAASLGGAGMPLSGSAPISQVPVQNIGNQNAVGLGRQMIPGLQGPGGYPLVQGSGQTQAPSPIFTTTGPPTLGGVTRADFDDLINLIQETIAPDSWEANGGTGRMAAFPSNLSLVVTQTQQVHDQIQDLLERLRELNDVQIVIEVRFITLQDNFFERIGVDFDFQINDNSGLPLNAPIPDELPGSRIVGRGNNSGAFNPTADLDLQFVNESFASAIPQFGGFDPNTAANFGFAILSDIEVFFLIQASKGNTRTNITQAPTVTLFNGQSATINDQSQRPFVTSIIPVVGDFAAAQMPVITILPEGTSLNVQATASSDRRFVKLNLVPFFSQIDSVDTFTFDGRRTTRRASDAEDDDDPAADLDDDEVIIEQEGTTVQLPVLSFTTVNTAVSVPDGGTVLLGGVKRFSEGRNERGVPFLSSIPYVNRLFKNVGIGRETQSLMMMVTPRIIIQAEEEQAQVGTIGN